LSSTASRLKKNVIKLLKEDVEFRYMVAGLIGLDEILKRLDRNEQELAKLREDMLTGFRRHDEELARLREDMLTGFKRHDEELAKLREDMLMGFKRYDEELAKLREDMLTGFRRHDEELARLRMDMNKLREDMNRGFELVERHISALGARWGLVAEEAFRSGLMGLVGRELGLRVERWSVYDEEGFVHGAPGPVEVDVAVVDDKTILVEVASHVKKSDVAVLRRKAELFVRKSGRRVDRLLMVTPYADEEALKMAAALGVEIYTKV